MGRPTMEHYDYKLSAKLRHIFFQMHEEASDYEGEFGKLMRMPPCVSFNTFVDNLDVHGKLARQTVELLVRLACMKKTELNFFESDATIPTSTSLGDDDYINSVWLRATSATSSESPWRVDRASGESSSGAGANGPSGVGSGSQLRMEDLMGRVSSRRERQREQRLARAAARENMRETVLSNNTARNSTRNNNSSSTSNSNNSSNINNPTGGSSSNNNNNNNRHNSEDAPSMSILRAQLFDDSDTELEQAMRSAEELVHRERTNPTSSSRRLSTPSGQLISRHEREHFETAEDDINHNWTYNRNFNRNQNQASSNNNGNDERRRNSWQIPFPSMDGFDTSTGRRGEFVRFSRERRAAQRREEENE